VTFVTDSRFNKAIEDDNVKYYRNCLAVLRNTVKCQSLTVVIAVLALALIGANCSADDSTPKKPMNVLFLIADDLNSWLLNDSDRYPGKVIAPNLRKLADSGVNFSRAYTASPVCSPSRTAFFSGVSPWKSGHYHNALQVKDSEPLKNALSLAGLFKNAGYTTASYGKITHGWDQKPNWDERVGHKRDPAPPGAPLTPVGRGEQDWGPIHLAEEEMNDTTNVEAAIRRLEKKHDRPFFIACGLFNPHMPWYVPQKYFDMFPLDELATPELLKNDLGDVPALGRALTDGKSKYVDQILSHGLHKEAVRAYLATTAYADVQIGRVLDALDTSPYRENTIVVFLTDHGFHLGEKHHWQKATLWEEATHCLLMFRVPGVTRAGGVSERFVSLQDIYPTLADLCGLEPPEYLDGRSLVPLLRDPNANWESTAISGLTDKGNPLEGYISIRNEQGRYIRYGAGQEEFYDTSKDPHEWTNQIAHPGYARTIQMLRVSVPGLAETATPMQPVRRK
jgi:arylsulfatase A-like enzyme